MVYSQTVSYVFVLPVVRMATGQAALAVREAVGMAGGNRPGMMRVGSQDRPRRHGLPGNILAPLRLRRMFRNASGMACISRLSYGGVAL